MSDVAAVLAQIRSFQTQLNPGLGNIGGVGGLQPPATPGTGTVEAPKFSDALANAIKKVNTLQGQTTSLQQAFERGEPGVDLARVMVAAQASSVAFRATVEVRNRLVQAYQDVMNMPL